MDFGPYDMDITQKISIYLKKGYGIDLDRMLVTTIAASASKKDSHPKAILKVYCPNSLDSKACHYEIA